MGAAGPELVAPDGGAGVAAALSRRAWERGLPLAFPLLDLEDRLQIFRKVCEAVAYAHEQGILHRDLKPANVLVMDDGRPQLLDFGIAKPIEGSSYMGTVFSTRTGIRLMTPTYASPEQLRGEPLTPASDVYSLGVMLFELITGRLPYQLRSQFPGEVLIAILEQDPGPPSRAMRDRGLDLADAFAWLDTLVPETLAKDPQQRPESAVALAKRLAARR